MIKPEIYTFILLASLVLNACNSSAKKEQDFFLVDVTYNAIGHDLSADNVERLISRPLEGLSVGIKTIKHVYSASFHDGAVISYIFSADTDTKQAIKQVKQLLLTGVETKKIPDYLPKPLISLRKCSKDSC